MSTVVRKTVTSCVLTAKSRRQRVSCSDLQYSRWAMGRSGCGRRQGGCGQGVAWYFHPRTLSGDHTDQVIEAFRCYGKDPNCKRMFIGIRHDGGFIEHLSLDLIAAAPIPPSRYTLLTSWSTHPEYLRLPFEIIATRASSLTDRSNPQGTTSDRSHRGQMNTPVG